MYDTFHIPVHTKATLVSLVCPHLAGHTSEQETLQSLRELRELLRTLEILAQSQGYQEREKVASGTMVGKGKLLELADLARAEESELLVFDFELTATQARNIEKITQMKVVDRCSVILEIFARHARTKEAQIQIEIFRLEYLLPRLTALWGHLSRQRGGIGVRSGEGEQQLELDRRIIKDRILYFKKQLEKVVISRQVRQKNREKKVLLAALVGHTNVGKSSLLNRLCRQNVLEEDKLFATLDVTYRALNPESHPPMVMIDTVGLISNLPTSLVSGFKTTLEAALEADLLVIVCDISDAYYERQLKVTFEFLKELGIDNKEYVIVFNKKDLLKEEDKMRAILAARAYSPSFLVSANDPKDMKELRQVITEHFLSKQPLYELFVPYDEGKAHSQIVANTNVLNQVAHQEGIFYRLRVPPFIFDQLGLKTFLMTPKQKRPHHWMTLDEKERALSIRMPHS